jgi:hypothetical protein
MLGTLITASLNAWAWGKSLGHASSVPAPPAYTHGIRSQVAELAGRATLEAWPRDLTQAHAFKEAVISVPSIGTIATEPINASQ